MSEARSEISTLCPFDRTKEERASRKALNNGLLHKIKKAVLIERPNEDLIAEVYFAGLYHGYEICRQQDLPPPRQVDYLDIQKPKRGRPRKAA